MKRKSFWNKPKLGMIYTRANPRRSKHEHATVWIGTHKDRSYWGCYLCGKIAFAIDKEWSDYENRDITKILRLCWGKKLETRLMSLITASSSMSFVLGHLREHQKIMLDNPRTQQALKTLQMEA